MANLTSTDVTDVLKELYPAGAPPEVVYKTNPLLAMLAKDREAYGELVKYPIVFGDPQGRSATFSTAQTNQAAGEYEAFDVTLVSDYGLASVNGDVIDKTKRDSGAFVRAVERETNGMLRQLTRSCAHALYRNGGGAIGQVSSITTTNLTLKQTEDVVFFEKNQEIASSEADGTSGSLQSGTATVTAVNRRTGVITTDTNWTTQITALDADDYLFVQGDFGGKLTGLQGWLPATDPSASEDHFGVDRSVDRYRLAGVYHDGSSSTIVEALLDGVQEIVNNGGVPDLCFMHPTDLNNLVKLLESKVEYSRVDTKIEGDKGKIGFRTVVVLTATADLQIVADINCPRGKAFALQMDTWELLSIGDVPRIFDEDGLAMLRSASADAVEIRGLYRAQLACSAPAFNGQINLPT